MSLPIPQKSATVQSQQTAKGNDAPGQTVKISFDDLLAKSGLSESVLLQRMADVLQRRSDGSAEDIISTQAAR